MNCQSGKIQYESDSQALAYAEAYNIGKYAHRQKTMRPYVCTLCGGWHVFTVQRSRHTRKKKAQRKRARMLRSLAVAVWEGEGGA